MSTLLRLEADILPNHSLGGLLLRTMLRDVQDIVTGLGISKTGSFMLITPFEARYRLGNGEVEIAVDVHNGKIFKLIAGPGYRGYLFGKITVGMSVAEAMALEPRLYYDEAEEFIRCRGVDGLTIDVPEIDPPAAEVPTMIISAISVFAAEITTLQGQTGYW